MANRYNDQDYPRYFERDDEYNRRSEYSSGRERAEGGSNDYGRGYNAMNYERDAERDRPYSNTENKRGSAPPDNTDDRRSSRADAGSFNRDDSRSSYDRQGMYGNTGRERGVNERDRDYNESERGYDTRRSGGDDNRGRGANSSDYGRGAYGGGSPSSYGAREDYDRSSSYYGQGGSYQRQAGNEREERTFMERASDEMASWFGDDDAKQRRQRDAREYEQGQYRGRGPRGYKRSDDRIRDDINDRLTDHPYLDASHIEVEVQNGEATLTGTVENRSAKRLAEDITESVSAVNHVENRLRVKPQYARTPDESYNQSSRTDATTKSDLSGRTGMSGTTAGTTSDFASGSRSTTSTNTTAEGGTAATGAVPGSVSTDDATDKS